MAAKPYGSGAKPHYRMQEGKWVSVVCGFTWTTAWPKRRLNDATPQEWDFAADFAASTLLLCEEKIKCR